MFQKQMTKVLYTIIFGSVFIIILNLVFSLTRNQEEIPISLGDHVVTDLIDRSQEFFDTAIPNPFEVTAPMIGHGLLLLDFNGNIVADLSFTYDENNFSQFVTLVNSTDKDSKVALLLYMEDRLLPYQVDGNDSAIVHSFDLKQQSYLYVPVSLQPQHVSESTPIYWVMIHGLEDPPEVDLLKRYYTTAAQATLTKSTDAQTYIIDDLPKVKAFQKREGIKDYPVNNQIQAGFSMNGFDQYTFDGFGIRSYEKEIFIDRSSSDQVVTFEAFGAPGSYTTAIFVDHQPIEVAGANQFQWSITEDEMIHVPFTLDESIREGQYVMYSVTFPTDINDSITRPVESEQFVITVK